MLNRAPPGKLLPSGINGASGRDDTGQLPRVGRVLPLPYEFRASTILRPPLTPLPPRQRLPLRFVKSPFSRQIDLFRLGVTLSDREKYSGLRVTQGYTSLNIYPLPIMARRGEWGISDRSLKHVLGRTPSSNATMGPGGCSVTSHKHSCRCRCVVGARPGTGRIASCQSQSLVRKIRKTHNRPRTSPRLDLETRDPTA